MSAFTTRLWAKGFIHAGDWNRRHLEDVHKRCVRISARLAARRLLSASEPGDATDAESEFGSSEYAKEILGALWGYPPELELERGRSAKSAGRDGANGIMDSAHDCTEGGIAVTLVESGLAKGIGINVICLPRGYRRSSPCLGRTPAAWLLLRPRELSRIKQIAVKYGIVSRMIGETASEQIEIKLDGRVVVSAAVSELREAYEGALEKALKTEPEPMAAD